MHWPWGLSCLEAPAKVRVGVRVRLRPWVRLRGRLMFTARAWVRFAQGWNHLRSLVIHPHPHPHSSSPSPAPPHSLTCIRMLTHTLTPTLTRPRLVSDLATSYPMPQVVTRTLSALRTPRSAVGCSRYAQPATLNPQPATLNPQLSTLSPQLSTLTLNPHPHTWPHRNPHLSLWLQSEEDKDDNDDDDDNDGDGGNDGSDDDLTGFASPLPIMLVDDVTADEQDHGTKYRVAVHFGGAERGAGYRAQPEGFAWPRVQQTASCPQRSRLHEYRPSASRPREK